MSSIQLNLQIEEVENKILPTKKELEAWVHAAMDGEAGEVTIKLVDEAEMTRLNKTYRQKDHPTNVLSFPYDFDEFDEEEKIPLLGDIAICPDVIEKEAKKSGVDLKARWAHIVLHGCLHLLGYDHHTNGDAEVMEHLETKILEKLGFENPYR